MPDDNLTAAKKKEIKDKLKNIAETLQSIESRVSKKFGGKVNTIKRRVLELAEEDPGTRNIGPGTGRPGGR